MTDTADYKTGLEYAMTDICGGAEFGCLHSPNYYEAKAKCFAKTSSEWKRGYIAGIPQAFDEVL